MVSTVKEIRQNHLLQILGVFCNSICMAVGIPFDECTHFRQGLPWILTIHHLEARYFLLKHSKEVQRLQKDLARSVKNGYLVPIDTKK